MIDEGTLSTRIVDAGEACVGGQPRQPNNRGDEPGLPGGTPQLWESREPLNNFV